VTKRVYAPGLIAPLSAICLASSAFAQVGWWRTYGGTSYDWGHSVQQTTDGGYIVAGSTYPSGSRYPDVYLIRTDAQGDTLWTRAYGGTASDFGASVQQTSDGGYIIAGSTDSYGAGDGDVFLIKTNAQGDTLWTRTYGGTASDFGASVQQTSDGGYVIAGYTASFGAGSQDVYLVKTNASGDTLWTRAYGGTSLDDGSSVQQTSDGGYIIAGSTYPSGSGYPDVYLIRTDAQGDTLWTRTYGGTDFDVGYSVQQTSDGGYIIAGFTISYGAGNDDVYLIKTNAQGDTLWTRTYGGTSGDGGREVRQTTDGGYIIAGFTISYGAGNVDVYLIKTNAQGDALWTRTYGGPDQDIGWSVQQTTDGGYIIAGYTHSFGAGCDDVYLIKTDANGNMGIEEPLTQHPADQARLLIQPNPFTSFARVPGHDTDVFTLSDITGRQVATCRGDRVGEGLRPGVYFLSPVGLKPGKAARATIIKAAY